MSDSSWVEEMERCEAWKELVEEEESFEARLRNGRTCAQCAHYFEDDATDCYFCDTLILDNFKPIDEDDLK